MRKGNKAHLTQRMPCPHTSWALPIQNNSFPLHSYQAAPAAFPALHPPNASICDVSLSLHVYTWERFRLFQHDHVQDLQSPGEIHVTGIVEKKHSKYSLTHLTKATQI